MKDWKAEAERLRGELKAVKEQLEYERHLRIERERAADNVTNQFRSLILQTLERK